MLEQGYTNYWNMTGQATGLGLNALPFLRVHQTQSIRIENICISLGTFTRLQRLDQ